MEKEIEIKICCVPTCEKQLPEWRIKRGWVTCSKRCSSAWNWTPTREREKIRGEKYGQRKTKKM